MRNTFGYGTWLHKQCCSLTEKGNEFIYEQVASTKPLIVRLNGDMLEEEEYNEANKSDSRDIHYNDPYSDFFSEVIYVLTI